MRTAQAFISSIMLAALVACGSPAQDTTAAVPSTATGQNTTEPQNTPAANVPAAVPQQSVATPANEMPERIALAQSDGSAAAPGVSEQFELGRHYRRLSPTQPTSSGADQVEVAEVFWYGCPHCYTFDPYIESWLAEKADFISFIRIPALWNPMLQLHARAFYTAEVLGKTQEMHTAFFREIHVNRNYLDNEQKLQTFFGRFGVDADTFTNTFNSFAVHTKVQRADELAKRYRIASVPMIVINGKYTADATSAGSYETLMDLIDELAASEASGN